MPTLPAFDQIAMDRRFLVELARLYDTLVFSTYGELVEKLGLNPTSILSQIEAGTYHCNHKLLYNLARHYPEADIDFVLFGGAAVGRPEPTTIPVRRRGRAWRDKKDSAARLPA